MPPRRAMAVTQVVCICKYRSDKSLTLKEHGYQYSSPESAWKWISNKRKSKRKVWNLKTQITKENMVQ